MLWLNKNKKLNAPVVGDKGQLGSYLKKLLQDDSRREKSLFGVVAGVDLPEVDICELYHTLKSMIFSLLCSDLLVMFPSPIEALNSMSVISRCSVGTKVE